MKPLALALTAALALAAAPAPQDPTPPPPAPQQDQRPPFDQWLAELRNEALSRGISAATLDAALATVTAPNDVVVARDRAQPERVQSLDSYVRQWLTARTTTTAKAMRKQHASLLSKVAGKYGPPPPVLIAVWGLESNFGRFTGTYPTVAALATLAYDPRRSRLFRAELFEALTILDRGQISIDQMKGSWAGAMGQPQFMPSSYLKHAVDFDGDGRADIWSSSADVFGSIANYLKSAGWVDGERWGREVKVSRSALDRIDREVPMRSSGCGALRELTVPRPLAEWAKLGVRLPSGAALPRADMQASLIRGQSRHFLAYRNYLSILDYNCSNAYAVSVGLLSDRLW
ncbi:MAG TPA: lytic murein transglycosylase [Vicinamibacterales bacterium]|nr:lytic murein transglycosylase [Vicinamibacterales bacterium]